jgi:arsenate reductase
LHHSFNDPPFLAKDAEDEVSALTPYRRVRDEIREFVAGIVEMM